MADSVCSIGVEIVTTVVSAGVIVLKEEVGDLAEGAVDGGGVDG